MRNLPALTRREVGSFFHSPMAYIVGVLFLFLSGLLFYSFLNFTQEASLQQWSGFIIMLLIFVAPILSMRQFAEERRVGTIETLMTAPVTDAEVVLAKFFGVLVFFLAMLAPTLIYIQFMRNLLGTGVAIDYGNIFTCYLAIVLVAGMFLSFGLFASSITNNQIVAAVIGIVALLCAYILLGLVPEPGSFAGTSWNQRLLVSAFTVLQFIHVQKHVDPLIKGIVDTRDVVYFLAFTGYFLFLTVRVLENRKWK